MTDARSLLESFAAALRAEAAEQRRQGGQPIALSDGRLVAADADTATYVFDLHAEVFLPEGVPVELDVAGARFSAEILYREGDRVVILVETAGAELPSPVPHAFLRAQPWFLHLELANRLDELTGDSGRRPELGAAELLLDRMLQPGAGRPRASRAVAARAPRSAALGGPLNPYQEEAVRACLAEPLWFVWGPPGTGKTATLGQLVARLSAAGERVLVAAHANVALDAAVLAVCRALGEERPPDVVRVGPPALDEVRHSKVSSRDRALERRPDLARRLADLHRELRRAGEEQKGAQGGRSREIARELREIRQELGEIERDIIADAPLLFATLAKTALTPEIYAQRFDAAIVDEASMAYPPQVLFASSLADWRLAVFGDFRQLPPVVVSQDPDVLRLLGRDVFDLAGVVAAVEQDAACELTMLRQQYRMHPAICRVVSQGAYLGRLEDAPGVRERTAVIAERRPFSLWPAVVVETGTAGSAAWRDSSNASRWNPLSAVWAVRFARDAADDGSTVAVLTPYRPQARLIGALIRALGERERIGVGTIHRYQGAERDAIVLDLVDAAPLPVPGKLLQGELGTRLMTVALSRARGKLIVLASAELLEAPGPAAKMLANVRRSAGLEPEGRLDGPEGSIEFFPDFRAAIPVMEQDLRGSRIYARLGYDSPLQLRQLAEAAGASMGRAPAGQAVLFTAQAVWMAGRAGARWVAVRAAAARAASAVGQILGEDVGRDVRRSRGEAGGFGGLPGCTRCGSPMVLEPEVNGAYVGALLACPSCRRRRPASLDEVSNWARLLDIRCPECGARLAARRGPSGVFLGCSTYPRCGGRQSLRGLA